MEITINDELPPAKMKMFVAVTPIPWTSVKLPDGQFLSFEGGPVGFLPIYDSLELLRKHSGEVDVFTLDEKS